MVGCLRRVELGGEEVDLRSLVGTDLAHKDATYDGCRVSSRDKLTDVFYRDIDRSI